MKLKFLRTPGGLPQFREGTTHEVKAADAKKFIATGIAVEAGGPNDPDVTATAAVEDAEVGADDEEVEAAANKAVFAARREDSKANRPPPAKSVSTTAAPTAQRSRPQPADLSPQDIPPVEAFDGSTDGGDDLDGLTVAELKEQAERDGVELKGHKKAEIIEELRAARNK